MKRDKYNFLLTITFVFCTTILLSQQKEILSNTNDFDYLIGIEYSDVTELRSLNYKSRTGMINKDKMETWSTNFVKGDYQIITSESVKIDPNTYQKIYKIQDIIVLNGYYHICGGCFITNKKNYTIKSFHPIDNVGKETVLIAFERNNVTGKYKPVNPKRYDWNSNTDKLLKKN